jgi:large subunit ribosomal protein L23
MAHLEEIILKPLITEKSSWAVEKHNRYGFEVLVASSKNQIKQAVEKLYDVKVINVKTCIVAGKTKRFGKAVKKTSKRKKAFVQLEDGQKIEFFKSV